MSDQQAVHLDLNSRELPPGATTRRRARVAPPVQASLIVLKFPSSQGVPFAAIGLSQTPRLPHQRRKNSDDELAAEGGGDLETAGETVTVELGPVS